jgi:hypothetical protein
LTETKQLAAFGLIAGCDLQNNWSRSTRQLAAIDQTTGRDGLCMRALTLLEMSPTKSYQQAEKLVLLEEPPVIYFWAWRSGFCSAICCFAQILICQQVITSVSTVMFRGLGLSQQDFKCYFYLNWLRYQLLNIYFNA